MNSLPDSQWSRLLDLFLSDKGGPTFKEEVYHFEDEVKTARYIHGVAATRTVFIEWLDSLRPITKYPGSVSESFRNQGNNLFRTAKHVGEAALLYTKAIYSAEAKSLALAQAHANRAAAVYKLGEFQAAYNDCECALKLNHPKPKTILLRQATCASSLRDVNKLEDCIKRLENVCLKENCAEIGQYRKNLENMALATSLENASKDDCRLLDKRQKIIRSKTRGRYVVADEPIAPNDVVMSEEAVACVPVVDRTHAIFSENCEHYLSFTCENCAENDIVPFPCCVCRNAAYCSPQCRDDHTFIHRHECIGYKVHLFAQIGIAHLAFRSLLVVFNEVLKQLKRIRYRQSVCRAEDLWPMMLSIGDDGELMGLCTNYHTVRNTKDIILYTLTASMLCCYLSHSTDFFATTRESRHSLMESETDWEIIVTALLLRLTSQMICNAHTIEGIVVRSPFSGSSSYEAGDLRNAICQGSLFSAIYPRTSLYNHACEANIRNKFDRAKLVVIATKELAVGKEILNCYGITSRAKNRKERMASLNSQYGFTCDCAHCLDGNDGFYSQYNHIHCKVSSCRTNYCLEDGQDCPRCGNSFDEDAYNHLLDSLDIMPETVSKYVYIVDLFSKLDHIFPRATNLRSTMLTAILSRFLNGQNDTFKTNEKLILEMLNLAKDLLETTEAIYGLSNLLFIQHSTFLLDLLALQMKQPMMTISLNYDLFKIESSAHECLTGKVKTKFLNYFREYACSLSCK